MIFSDVKVKKDDLGNVTAWIEIDDLIVAKVMEKEALELVEGMLK